MTALGDNATVPKILNSLYECRVGKGLIQCIPRGIPQLHTYIQYRGPGMALGPMLHAMAPRSRWSRTTHGQQRLLVDRYHAARHMSGTQPAS